MNIELANAMPAVHLAGVSMDSCCLQTKKREGRDHPFTLAKADLSSTCKTEGEVIPCTIAAWDEEAIALSKKEKDDTLEVLAMPIPSLDGSFTDVPVFQAVHVISRYTDASHISQETYRALYCGENNPPQLLNTIHFSARATEKPECRKIAFGKGSLDYISTIVDLESDAKENGQVIPCRLVAWDVEAVKASRLEKGTRFSFLAEPVAMRQSGKADTLAFRIACLLTDNREWISREAFIKLFQC